MPLRSRWTQCQIHRVDPSTHLSIKPQTRGIRTKEAKAAPQATMSSRRKAPQVQSGKQNVGEQRRKRRKLRQEQGAEEARRIHAYEEVHTSEEGNRDGRGVHIRQSTRACPIFARSFEKYRAHDEFGTAAQDEAEGAAGSRHGSMQEKEQEAEEE